MGRLGWLRRYGTQAARALSRLRGAPGFTLLAVLALIVAVVPSVVFTLAAEALLPPLPYPRPEGLVAVSPRYGFGRGATSYPKLDFLRQRSRTLEVAALTGLKLFLTPDGRHAPVRAIAVTPQFFDVLGAKLRLGRAFSPGEDRVPFARPVVVISEAFWRRELGARTDIVGQQIPLNGVGFTVVGVADASFRGWWGVTRRWLGFEYEDAWIPSMMAPVGMIGDAARDARVIESSQVYCWLAVARMRPGVSLGEARAELNLLSADARRIWPDGADGSVAAFEAVPLAADSLDPKIVRIVGLLRIAGLLVAALGAFNLGTLLLARGLGRARTYSLEQALGATRAQILFGAGFEAVAIGAAGAAGALLVTRCLLALLGHVEPTAVQAPFGFALAPAAGALSTRAAIWALGVGLGAGLVAGLAAAARATAASTALLLRSGAFVSRPGLGSLRPTRPGGLLVVVEIALAVALTVPALLLVRSARNLIAADPGFRPDGAWTTSIGLPSAEYDAKQAITFVKEAVEALREQPGVAGAGWLSVLPFQGSYTSLVGRSDSKRNTIAYVVTATPGALRLLGVRLVSGREFGDRDPGGASPAVVLSERGAKALGVEPGARIDVLAVGIRSAEVVGVAADVPYGDPAAAPAPAVYLPLALSPQLEGSLVVRSDRPDVRELAGAVVAGLDRTLPHVDTRSLRSHAEHALARFRAAAWLLGIAALLALTLSATGVQGVLSALVAGSTAEIGIRIAIGATPAIVAWHLLRATLVLAVLGIGLGLVAGVAGSGSLEGDLYRVGRFDVAALAASAATSVVLAMLAAWLPISRLLRGDPVTALRSE